jgi:hypothetical protein
VRVLFREISWFYAADAVFHIEIVGEMIPRGVSRGCVTTWWYPPEIVLWGTQPDILGYHNFFVTFLEIWRRLCQYI